MRQYETIFIVDPTFEADAIEEVVERFKSLIVDLVGKVTEVDEWVKRRLAYPINDHWEGYYFLMHFAANPEQPRP